MNAPSSPKIEFVDLKAQYRALKPSIDARIQRVLDHGQFIMGPEVAELEEKLAQLCGARHCVTCASGTEALLIALMALDLKPGDEVITTPFTFIATAEVIVLLGAVPVFVDVEPDTCNIDVSQIEAAITPRTRAVIPVSLYGQPADMDDLSAICTARDIAIIEDAAQSFGARYKGRWSGNLSTIGCTSFFPSKPLGCYGDGGAMFTNDDAIAKAMREIRVHGQSKRYVHTRIGVGGRMDSIQCAVVLAKLERFEWEIERRITMGKRYGELLAREAAGKVEMLTTRQDRTNVHAQYTVLAVDRGRLQEYLSAKGIPTAVHYPIPIHLQPAYRQFARDGLGVSERLADRVVSLPMHPDLTDDLLQFIVAAVAESPLAG